MTLKKYCLLYLMLLCYLNIQAQNKEGKIIDTLQTERLEEVIISPFHINTKL